MAASTKALQELHAMLAEALTARLRQDMEDKLPTDAATMGVITKFLKDNNISADPADSDNLDELRERFARQSKERSAKRASALQGAAHDITLN